MNIVVTGASRGIGYELVRYFAADPVHTIVAVSRNQSRLEQLKALCSSGNVEIFSCDLSDVKETEKLCVKLKGRLGSIDILINNAGTILHKPFSEITAEELRYVYEVNVFSAVRLIQQLIPFFTGRERGHVVNIGSMGGFQGSAKFSGLSAYSSAKAALACLTECLAEEFRDKNISFNCLALGAVQTEMLEEAFPGYKAPVTAGEMAAFIGDFALKAGFYLNGKVVPVSKSTP